MKNQNMFAPPSLVNLVRRSLLLSDAPAHYSDLSQYGITFRLEHCEKFNAMHLSGSRRAVNQYRLSKLAAHGLNRRNSIDVEHCSPSSIIRMTVSKKKMKRTTRMLTQQGADSKRNTISPLELGLSSQPVAEGPHGEIKGALRKIRGFGLLMHEFRGDLSPAIRSKSAAKTAKSKKDSPPPVKSGDASAQDDDTERRMSFEKLFDQDRVKPRRESIIQTFNNITRFVSALMKEGPEEQRLGEDTKGLPNDSDEIIRRSSYYSKLSEGSLTDSDGSFEDETVESSSPNVATGPSQFCRVEPMYEAK